MPAVTVPHTCHTSKCAAVSRGHSQTLARSLPGTQLPQLARPHDRPSKLVMRRVVSLPWGHLDICEFRLVADAGLPPISVENWQTLWSLIVHLQPARSAALEGDPPRAIRVEGLGGTEIAPGLLADLERLAMISLHVEVAAGFG